MFKDGDVVKINKEFFNNFLRKLANNQIDGSGWNEWILRHNGYKITISEICNEPEIDIYSIRFRDRDNEDCLITLTKNNDLLIDFKDQINAPFFILDVPKINNLYCCCQNPKIKHIYLGPNLDYDFCSVCKKERR